MENIVDNSWNFKGANTKELTHCYHNYPAMMIPQIARRLVHEYKQKSTFNRLDPYCGSGTSLVESLLQNINATGFDINPLAVFLSGAKITLFSIKLIKLTKSFDEYITHIVINIMYAYRLSSCYMGIPLPFLR